MVFIMSNIPNTINALDVKMTLPKDEIWTAKGKLINFEGHTYQLMESNTNKSWHIQAKAVMKLFFAFATCLFIPLLIFTHKIGQWYHEMITGKRKVEVYILNDAGIEAPKATKPEKQPSEKINNNKENSIKENESKINSIITVLEKNNSEPLSDENLDKMLDFVNYTHQNLNHQQQYEKFIRELDNHFKIDQIEQAWSLGLIPAEVNNNKKVLSDQSITFIVQRIKNFYMNEQAFIEVHKQVLNTYGNTNLLEKAYEKFDKTPFLKGHLLLSEEIKGQIIELIGNVYKKQSIDDLLKQIEEYANKDLILNDSCIEKQFKVQESLDSLSSEERVEKRKKLQVIINKASLQREFSEKIKFKGPSREKTLLKYLGIEINGDYTNTEKVYDIFQQIVQVELQNEQNFTGSLDSFRKNMNRLALQARLKAVNIVDCNQVDKFRVGLNALWKVQKKLIDFSVGAKLSFSDNFPIEAPLARQYILQNFRGQKWEISEDVIEGYFHKDPSIEKIFSDESVNSDDFAKRLVDRFDFIDDESSSDKKKLMELYQDQSQHVKGEIDFYSKWGTYLKKELIQGSEDDNEVLGYGVCYAICLRLQMLGQRQSDISAEDFSKHVKIHPIDRFRQAFVKTQKRFDPELDFGLPENILKAQQFKNEDVLFQLEYDSEIKDLDQTVKTNLDRLQQGNGWISLRLIGAHHAILARFDEARNKFWLFDPNAGFFCFEDKAFDNAKTNCFEFLNDLIAHLYPTTSSLLAIQLVSL